jgi:hypothetical protein
LELKGQDAENVFRGAETPIGQCSYSSGSADALVEAFRQSRLLDKAELIIAELDELSGDPDLEDDDPAGGNCEDEGEADTIWTP